MGTDYLFPRFEVLRDDARCIRCGGCAVQCPHGVHQFDRDTKALHIQASKCVNCQRCAAYCPRDAIRIQPSACRFRENGIWQGEDLRNLHIQAATGGVLLASCGGQRNAKDYFSQLTFRAAQATATPVDPLREPPSVAVTLGKERTLALKCPILFAAMSFGSISYPAHRALAEAARQLGTCWNSGEGGLHPELLPYGPNTVVQVASGRFGVSRDILQQAAAIELKFGQGAKPGIGGHLPAEKVTPAVAALRGISEGTDAISPAASHDIHCMEDLAQLIPVLRKASGGKPIIVKVAAVQGVGEIACGIAKCGADILCIDGCHGGTGAAPMDIRDHVGIPLALALAAADSALKQAGLRQQISVIGGGSIRSAADAAKAIALGADACYIGTAALVALGCRLCGGCHSGRCAWGIATQDPALEKRLQPDRGARRLQNLVNAWVHSLADFLGAMGMHSLDQLQGNRAALQGIGLTDTELQILGVQHAGA